MQLLSIAECRLNMTAPCRFSFFLMSTVHGCTQTIPESKYIRYYILKLADK